MMTRADRGRAMQDKRRGNDASRRERLVELADNHPEFKLIIAGDMERIAAGLPLEGVTMSAEELRARARRAL